MGKLDRTSEKVNGNFDVGSNPTTFTFIYIGEIYVFKNILFY